jgi:predicted N-acetyltransferase YhbS
MNTDALPIGLVALADAEPVGTLALAERAIRSDLRLAPAVIGLWVAERHRRRGIASCLLREASVQVRVLGHPMVYAATGSAAALFLRCGWDCMAADNWDGEAVQIFRLRL